ncbi:MAG: RagB/SusD family nutrient uptake outer membrane protein, partial [Paludibacter sp.]|nr:RagB/SusD family nutrient uptake outer membrane protein [Paludibacter sp.]
NGSGDWGDNGRGALGSTRANWTTVFTRPRWGQIQKDVNGNPTQGTGTMGFGWGWNRPSQELYDEFEQGDMRRDATIINPQGLDSLKSGYCPYSYYDIDKTFVDTTSSNLNQYLGNRYSSRKYAEMNADTTFWGLDGNNPRGTINHKEIRYSDVLLMYAEACVKSSSPDLAQARWALEQVRARARAFSGGGNVLPAFPNYSISLQSVGGSGIKQLQDNADDLLLAIRHERRVELGMEGHRWFDLKRWGLLEKVMNNYKATTKPQIGELMNQFVAGKNELFPIPMQEIDLNPMEQNSGY